MQILSIGVEKYAQDVLEYISNELVQLKNDNIDYTIDKIDNDGVESIICKISDKNFGSRATKNAYKILILNVSNALADYIIRCHEEKLINRIINLDYCYFNHFERKEILKETSRIIRNEDKSFLNALLQIRRRNIIVKKLIDYFENSNKIILDGFINFRLKEYVKDLEEIVNRAVDSYLMEKEYNEFIKLLKYFVDIQEPKFENIQIIVDSDGKYTLLDDMNEEITNECIKDYLNEISEGEINYDDLLVSSLITLAPVKVTIHGVMYFKNKELLETIKNIFPENVMVCNGCSICNMHSANNKNMIGKEIPDNIY